MSGSIRVSAKTVEDAITEASIQLGVTSDELEYEVIEKGSAGFFGIGMKQAVIEAKRKHEEEPASDIISSILGNEEISKDQKEYKREYKKEYKKDNRRDHRKDYKKDYKKERKEYVKEERPKAEENPAEKPAENPAMESVNQETPAQETGRKETVSREVPTRRETKLSRVTNETKAAVEQFLQDTLKAMDMEVTLESSVEEDGSLSIELGGDNMGILIGKRGQTLDALQYLANRVANKHQSGYVRVKLDTENYRAKREETLRHLAKNIAYKVKKTRRPVALEPMNPYERRIIHSALQSDPYVTTHSEGEEPYRRVVVTLKR